MTDRKLLQISSRYVDYDNNSDYPEQQNQTYKHTNKQTNHRNNPEQQHQTHKQTTGTLQNNNTKHTNKPQEHSRTTTPNTQKNNRNSPEQQHRTRVAISPSPVAISIFLGREPEFEL
jgi:FtsZ-interacting cell division protein YlmF